MIFRLVHSSEFREKVEDYAFPNTTYPWEIYEGTFRQLGDASYTRDRALLLENDKIFADDMFYDPVLGMLDNSLARLILILLNSRVKMFTESYL